MNIREKFIQLTQYTEVIGQEYMLEKHLPEGINEDHIGNYWIKIGESDTMFTSHLDTAAHARRKVKHQFDSIKTKRGTEEHFIETDGTTVLGADDRAGVVLMLNMIEHKIPGLYYFFMGEESGTIGSSNILLDNPEIFEPYNKCISFDRKGYDSIITVQMGGRCCSPAFSSALAKDINNVSDYSFKADPTGIYTDSAVFMDDIAECTNISVGYFNEHSTQEFQNITFLEDLCEAVLKVKWEELPIERKPGPIETPNPIRKPKKEGDLNDQELGYIFMMIEDIFEETQQKECANGENFIPEKEMLFVSWYDDSQIVSVWIHEDGSITIGKDKFETFGDLEDQIEAVYGYRTDWGKLTDDDDDEEDNDGLPFDPDEPEEEHGIELGDNIDLSNNTFEDGIDIDKFIKDIDNLKIKKISAPKINSVLNKYNKTIESLVIWLYHNHNDPFKTQGLTWDDESDNFEFDTDYFEGEFSESKSSGTDTHGARTFN